LKINKSQIARELKVNRKIVDKYLNGFQKSDTRAKSNYLVNYLDTIEQVMLRVNYCSACDDVISSYAYVFQEREIQVREEQACGQGIAALTKQDAVVVTE